MRLATTALGGTIPGVSSVKRFAYVGALLVALLTSTSPGQVILSDSTFASANWSAAIPSTHATFSQVTTGGDPGSFGEITLTDPTPAAPPGYENAVGGIFFSSQLIYTPSVEGAIRSLSFSIDTESITGSSTVLLALEQDGDLIFPSNGPGVVTSNSWQGYSEILSTGGVAGIPNFTATGDPIEFGVYVDAMAPANINSAVGIDNLVIDISEAPEPSTLGLLLAAGLIGSFCLSRFQVASR
jgi:hypothetical protein